MSEISPVTVSNGNTASGSLRLNSAGCTYRAGPDHRDLKSGAFIAVEAMGRRRIARIRTIEPATETTFDVAADWYGGGC